jgi:hypothetical protein
MVHWTKQDHRFSASITLVISALRFTPVPCVKWITMEGEKILGEKNVGLSWIIAMPTCRAVSEISPPMFVVIAVKDT